MYLFCMFNCILFLHLIGTLGMLKTFSEVGKLYFPSPLYSTCACQKYPSHGVWRPAVATFELQLFFCVIKCSSYI